jgi:hypothetical protein
MFFDLKFAGAPPRQVGSHSHTAIPCRPSALKTANLHLPQGRSGGDHDFVQGGALLGEPLGEPKSYTQKAVDFEQFRGSAKSIGFYWLVINHAPAATAAKAAGQP